MIQYHNSKPLVFGEELQSCLALNINDYAAQKIPGISEILGIMLTLLLVEFVESLCE